MRPDIAAFLGGGPPPIEDFGLIGDGNSAALVSRAGTVAWLCWPRFDSPACFASVLGRAEHGEWRIAPDCPDAATQRRYRGDTLVLETSFETPGGAVTVTDAMPLDQPVPTLARRVTGTTGAVAMRMAMVPRFGYGTDDAVFSPLGDAWRARPAPGGDGVLLQSSVRIEIDAGTASARFTIRAGESVDFVLSHAPDDATRPRLDVAAALAGTAAHWQGWADRSRYVGPHDAAVRRSLLTLKALVHRPTGGIVAAPTTSLPEALGGTRNWDYRFCWLRDASLTLLELMRAGYVEEARAWRDWLRRALDAEPDTMRIMYGLGGERELTERIATWLPGYQGAVPVRIGNAAHDQLQLDVYGEVADALTTLRDATGGDRAEGWDIERGLIEHLESIWQEPDEGMWEVRGGRRRFTLSAVMAWVALDRTLRSADRWGLPAPTDRWRRLRDRMHADICAAGFDAAKGSFVQSFGSTALDASLLLIPAVGFLPADDWRVRGTVAAIERELLVDGFVHRYDTKTGADGLPPGEGAFLACSFWLVDAFHMQGRVAEAHELFERLLCLRNDLGLLAEEYDPVSRRQLGNFPQAFSHAALIGTAFRLASHR